MCQTFERKIYLDYYNSNNNIQSFTNFLSSFKKPGVIINVYYWRIYNNQSGFLASTNGQWLKNFLFHYDKFGNTLFEEKLQNSLKLNTPVYAIWDTLGHDKLLQFAHQYNVHTGFDIYIKQNGYIEVFTINGDKFCNNFTDFCINNLHHLHKALNEVREEYKKIEDNRFRIPIKLATPQKFFISNNGRKVFLTERELECTHYMLKGYTIKGIAQKLDISPRTVESHITSIKQKFGVNFKPELIKKLQDEILTPITLASPW